MIWLILALSATLLAMVIELLFRKSNAALGLEDEIRVEEVGPKSYSYLAADCIMLFLAIVLELICFVGHSPG